MSWSSLSDALGQSVPSCRVSNAAGTSIPNATDTAIPFASESYDTDSMHDTVTNNTRITINTPGVYMIAANVTFAGSSVGSRSVYLRLNGSTVIGYMTEKVTDDATQGGGVTITVARKLNAGDYVEVMARQTSGGALALSTSGSEYTACAVTYLGGPAGIFQQTPAVRVSRSGTQSIPTGVSTQVLWNAETYDEGTPSNDMHDTSTNSERLYCRVPGVYAVEASVEFTGGSGGTLRRYVSIWVNGTTEVAREDIYVSSGTSSNSINVSGQVKLNAGDYISVFAFHDATAAMNIAGVAGATSAAMVMLRSNSGDGPQRVTSLPSSPYDGQEIYYVADATAGVIWHLRYNASSASAYKWEFVGGGSKYGSLTNKTWTTLGGSFQYTDTTFVQNPLEGDYEIYVEGDFTLNSGSSINFASITFGVDDNASGGQGCGSATPLQGQSAHFFGSTIWAALPANSNMRLFGYAPGFSVNVTASNMRLRLRPIRVG
jgi:hypothetical protein